MKIHDYGSALYCPIIANIYCFRLFPSQDPMPPKRPRFSFIAPFSLPEAQ